jgi:hypothetical protein
MKGVAKEVARLHRPIPTDLIVHTRLTIARKANRLIAYGQPYAATITGEDDRDGLAEQGLCRFGQGGAVGLEGDGCQTGYGAGIGAGSGGDEWGGMVHSDDGDGRYEVRHGSGGRCIRATGQEKV